jgi:hypothetical protein
VVQETQRTKSWLDSFQAHKLENQRLERLPPLLTASKEAKENIILESRASIGRFLLEHDELEPRHSELQDELIAARNLLGSNLREKRWNHDNAVSALAQTTEESQEEVRFGQLKSELLEANAAVTADNHRLKTTSDLSKSQRDTARSDKWDMIMSVSDKMLQVANLEQHIASVEEANSQLASAISEHQALNSDLSNHNQELVTQNALVRAARDAARLQLDHSLADRNSLQHAHDWTATSLYDVKKDKPHADSTYTKRQVLSQAGNTALSVCESEQQSLLQTQATLQAQYDSLSPGYDLDTTGYGSSRVSLN